jgi:hypothetical protein
LKKRWYNRNLGRARQAVVDRRKRYRSAALEKLGNRCIQCGFDDQRALQIDHIDGGGCKESRVKKEMWLYKRIMDGHTQGYQLLCANCNWIKRVDKKEVNRGKIILDK